MDPLKVGLAIGSRELAEQARKAVDAAGAQILFEAGTSPKLFEGVDRLRPDLVIVGGADTEAIARVRRTDAAPQVIVVSETLEPEDILTAMRAGAREYATPPLAAGLAAALDRLSRERLDGGGGRSGRAFGFLSVKGGCGATTISCHVAVEMQRRGTDKILLADLDLSCGLIRFLMRCNGPYSVADAIRNTGRLDPSYWRALVCEKGAGLDVVTAPSEDCVADAHDPGEMGEVLRFAKTQYSWVVADLGRGLGATARNAAAELDALALVSTLEIAALNRARAVTRALLDGGVAREKLRLVLNRAPARSDLNRAEIERAIGVPVFDVVPDCGNTLEDAYTDGRLLAPGHPARARCGRLADKLVGREPRTKPRTLWGLIPIGGQA